MLSGHFRPRIDDILSVNHAGFVNNQSFDLFLTDQYFTTGLQLTAFWLRRREAEGPDNNDKIVYFSILQLYLILFGERLCPIWRSYCLFGQFY